MKHETAKLIIAEARFRHIDVELMDSYSGRDMGGEVTTAVMGSKTDIQKAITWVCFYLGQKNINPSNHPDLWNPKWDDLGKQKVCY